VNLSLLRHTVLLFLMTPEQTRRTTRKRKGAARSDPDESGSRRAFERRAEKERPGRPVRPQPGGTSAPGTSFPRRLSLKGFGVGVSAGQLGVALMPDTA
jgi:hypothetical protein